MDRLQRRVLACLTAFAVLAAIAQGVSGATDRVLFLTPLFLIAALLLSGRYLAEDRIVRRWQSAVANSQLNVIGSWELGVVGQLDFGSCKLALS